MAKQTNRYLEQKFLLQELLEINLQQHLDKPALKKVWPKTRMELVAFLTVNIGKEPIINHERLLTSIAWGRKKP